MKIIVLIFLLIIGAIVITLGIKSNRSSATPKSVGLLDGQLQLCGEKPNCVCTRNVDEKHKLEPIITNSSSWETVQVSIESALKNMSNYQIVENLPNYMRIEFRSSVFKFTDDFELHFLPSENKLNLRSASRVGYSDLGANRSRAAKFKTLFEKAQ